jgi:tRNA pseudouridine synthase 10
LCEQESFEALKAGADSKRKKYGCVVWISQAMTQEKLAILDALVDVHILQDTPVRVCHRRSLMTRKKIIHAMKTSWINPHFFQLELTTSAGTYVKEFVHGDRGRTSPNIGSLLGCEADILQLDVLDLIFDASATTGPTESGDSEDDD